MLFQKTNLKKFRPDVKCSPKVVVDEAKRNVTLDFSHLVNLSVCDGSDVPYFSEQGIGKRDVSKGANFFKPNDDVRLGEDFVREFNKENATTIYPADHAMTRYLQRKMDAIAKNSDEPGFKPRVYVINADVINAFALPGGAVYVYRGLIERSPNEAALMGVLGHEWAHVTARHGTKNMTKALKLIYGGMFVLLASKVAADLTNDDLLKVAYTVMGYGAYVGAQLLLLKHSRDAELEADRLGSQYALQTGYSPLGIGQMFEEFKKSSSEVTSLEKLLSTHPSHDERIETNKVLSSLFYPVRSNYIVDPTQDYLLAVNELGTLPKTDKVSSEKVASAFIQKLKSTGELEIVSQMRIKAQEAQK